MAARARLLAVGVIRSLIALGHLGRWMGREALRVDQLTAAAVSALLGEYRSVRWRLPTASVWPLGDSTAPAPEDFGVSARPGGEGTAELSR